MEIIPARASAELATRTSLQQGRARWRTMTALKRLRKLVKYADIDRASRKEAVKWMERTSAAHDDLASPDAEEQALG